MAIEFSCGQCDARLKLPDTAAGRRGRCRKCGHVFTVPSPPADDGEIDLAAFSEPVAPIQPIAPMTPVINPKANTPAAKRRITLATHPLQASLCLVGGALGVVGGLTLIIYGFMGIFSGEDTSRAWTKAIVGIGTLFLMVGGGLVARGLGAEMPTANEQARGIAQENARSLNHGQFFALVVFVLFLVNVFVLIGIWKLIFDEGPPGELVILPMGAVILALVEVLVAGKLTGWEILQVDLSQRPAKLILGGLGVAFVFALVLSLVFINNDREGKQKEQERQAARDEYYGRLRDPNVQRGLEAYQRIQAQREQRDADTNTE